MGTAALIAMYAGAVLAVIAFAVMVFFAERSLKRQRGSQMRRSREEALQLSHAASLAARSGSGGGSA